MTLKQIEKTVLKRPRAERAFLAEKLIESLDVPDDNDFDQEWFEEVERRRKAVESGKSKLVPLNVVVKELRALVKK